ncbi:reelin domain-containing protein 1 isoform X1 [Sphaerodactylus townsendi]|uniref:reelin domain-containing protein 1 isoform X1 n=1 Tax=Sphaerodactylus townsendi TaxID=933632 RepID=UPI0020265054|nr:reelin domain-containing protein 1 isoform X1 [Sphaerodactylus townsendi]XP_048364643.1 reelin domain-containing protein 1 isoform X1 [Sphaerodactylus townsendi]
MAEDEVKAQALFVVWAFTVLCLVSYTAAFSHGASLSACTDMRPKHIRAHLQNPHNNYITLHTNMSVFFPGDKIPVTVRSTRDFMGFMLQARRVSNDQIAGTFVYIPPGSKLLACFEDGDTVTHSDKSLKRNLSFVWKAPDQPIGDIRFFLSVVQSYFVYWARIESSTVYHQTPNRTTADRRVTFSAIKPTLFQQPPNLKGGSITGSSSYTILTQFANVSSTSMAQIAATLILEPGDGRQQMSELPGKQNLLSESLADSVTSHAISQNGERQPNGNGTDGELMLESSLQFQDLGFMTRDYSSVLSRYNRTENASSIPKSSLCSTCTEGIEVASESSNWGVWNLVLPITASPLIQLWDPLLLSEVGTTSKYLGGEKDSDASRSLSAASWQMVKENPVTQKGPANFLPQAELTAHSQEKEDQEADPLLKVTRTITKDGAPGDGGAKPGQRPQLVAAQLGVLLGCSVVLGMVLAIGLRCIHSQYCHKRTEVSFSEPENNVIALRESGEMMHFRKIRENSFVLVQAEYNWINPANSGKKAVI